MAGATGLVRVVADLCAFLAPIPEFDGGVHVRIALKAPHFTVVPEIAESTDLIATVPSYVIQRSRARPMLKMLELPYPMPRFEVKQGWRQCNHDDVANRWLRGVTSERFTKT